MRTDLLLCARDCETNCEIECVTCCGNENDEYDGVGKETSFCYESPTDYESGDDVAVKSHEIRSGDDRNGTHLCAASFLWFPVVTTTPTATCAVSQVSGHVPKKHCVLTRVAAVTIPVPLAFTVPILVGAILPVSVPFAIPIAVSVTVSLAVPLAVSFIVNLFLGLHVDVHDEQ